jgi:DeoR/GlpR family transcriptional regulator of sugar metabolism
VNLSARRAAIREDVRDRGEVGLAELALRFDVSEMTVRRDLEALEAEGVARRVRGGAISVAARSYEPTFENRAVSAPEAKAAIAARAAGLVDSGESVALDSGTTVLALARALRGRGLELTVLTPSVLAAVELADEPGLRVLLAGGTVRPRELSMIGPTAEEFFADCNCDVLFLSAAGIDAGRGLTDYNMEEARVKRAAVRCARRVVALMDRRKFDRVYFANVLPLSGVDVLVTDAEESHPTVCEARAAGIDVLAGVGR